MKRLHAGWARRRRAQVRALGGLFSLSLFASTLTNSCLTPSFEGLGVGGEGGRGDGHCYNAVSDADETGINCGGKDCDSCDDDAPCREDSDCDSNSCRGGICKKPSCTDFRTNGDETGPDCGGKTCETRCDVTQGCAKNSDCEAPPEEASGDAQCVQSEDGGKVCRLQCPARTGDCNETAEDGCEERTETSKAHCGACFHDCSLPFVAHARCEAGACKISSEGDNQGCEPGHHDCDGLPENGCEANFDADEKHCGGCNQACSSENGTSRCVDGECQIECKKGFQDCNQDARSDGCETDIASVNDCGGCGEDDPRYICKPKEEGWSPYCLDNKCGSVNCEPIAPGHGACDGDKVCDDPLDTIANCGVCGQICVVTGGTPACKDKTCVIGKCEPNRRDCDALYMSGCEVDVTSDRQHCGDCTSTDPSAGDGDDCTLLEANESLHVLSTACSGSCQITSCDPGYGDCDNDPKNGCEADITSEDQHCGGCTAQDPRQGAGEDCDSLWGNAAGSCTDGTCVFIDCDDNFADCEGDATCETNARTPDNCGRCGVHCGGDGAHVSGTPSCSDAGKCQVKCDDNRCPDLADPERACTSPLGVEIANCEACGEVCGGSEPFCDPALGCRQLFPVTLVSDATTLTAAGGSLKKDFNLKSATNARGRAVIVGIATTRSVATVRFGGSDMIRAATTAGNGEVGYSSIYYLLGAALGSPGSKSLEITTTPSSWGGVTAIVMEVTNLAQTEPTWVNTTRTGDGPCSENNKAVVFKVRQTPELAFKSSLVVSALAVRGAASSAAATTALAPVLTGGQTYDQSQGWMAYDLAETASPVAIGWDVSGGDCWDVAVSSVVFSPVIEDGPSE